jgi:methionyl-tRNA formyltransferase
MKFAITAVDRYLGVFDAFVAAGWTPLKLFTVPAKCELSNQDAVISYAERHAAAVQLSRMSIRDLEELRDQGCEALVVASYDWKICDWRPFLRYAVNFHSSPLPDGRGPYPVMRAIMEERESWGVACHRLTSKIDSGEVLAEERFPLRPDESHEGLDLKIQMAAKRLAHRVARQFVPLWNHAQPQGEGTYWRKYELLDHLIDFHKSVDCIMLHVRAFGPVGSLASVCATWVAVKRAIGWTEAHSHAAGTVVHVFNQAIVVAASDGYIGILQSEILALNVASQIDADLALRARDQATNA